jgi:hypothetical protein
MAREEQGDHRFLQEWPGGALKVSEGLEHIDDHRISTIEQICLGATPMLSISPMIDDVR